MSDSETSLDSGPRITTGWPLLGLASMVIFIDSIGYGVVIPVLPVYAKTLDVGDFQVGFLFATYAIALVLSSIPFGLLSDRYGRKPFVLFGMFAMSGAFIFYALAESYWMLVLGRVLDGLTAAATWTVALALIADRFPDEVLGEKMGFAMAAAAVGGMAGPLVGGVLYDTIGYRAPFYAVAAACALGGALSLFLREDRTLFTRSSLQLVDSIRLVFKNRTIRLVCLVIVITTIGMGLIEPTLPIYLEENFSMSSTGIGLIFLVLTVCFGAASPLVGRLSDRLGRKRFIMIGLVAAVVFTPILGAMKNLAALFILMGVLGIAFALFSTPALPLVTDAMHRSEESMPVGTAFGLVNLFWSLGYALGPLAGGAIMGWNGLFTATLFYSFLVAVTVVIVALYLKVE